MTERDKEKKRARPIILQSRVSEDEAALIRDQAEKARVSVSALIRYALLNQTPLRASRSPGADRQEIARLIAALGSLAQALRDHENSHGASAHIEAMQCDLADIRCAAFEALGREP